MSVLSFSALWKIVLFLSQADNRKYVTIFNITNINMYKNTFIMEY